MQLQLYVDVQTEFHFATSVFFIIYLFDFFLQIHQCVNHNEPTNDKSLMKTWEQQQDVGKNRKGVGGGVLWGGRLCVSEVNGNTQVKKQIANITGGAAESGAWKQPDCLQMQIWNPQCWQQIRLHIPTFSFRQPAIAKPAQDFLLHHSDFDQTDEESTCVSASWPPVGGKVVIKTNFNNGGDSPRWFLLFSLHLLHLPPGCHAPGLEGPSRPVIMGSLFPLKTMYRTYKLYFYIQRGLRHYNGRAVPFSVTCNNHITLCTVNTTSLLQCYFRLFLFR